jgi:GNAT superfamily N-acetyltransferase
MPTSFVQTDASHPHFVALVRQLDADLALRDGDDHAFYAQFNGIAHLQHVLLAYVPGHEEAIACGAIKPFDSESVEVKRMWVEPAFRGRGIASALLQQLEQWAVELGYQRCVLETGKKQVEALGLYPKNGYRIMANYGQYQGMDNSVCFEKWLG